MTTTNPVNPAPPAAAPKPRPKSVPREAPGLENHPTANPNYRGNDPRPKAPVKGEAAKGPPAA